MGSDDESCQRQLHIFLLPFMAHGHMIPIVDMAKLFASRGIKITIVTTPLNSIFISKSLQKIQNPHIFKSIQLLILRFPSSEAGLPDGCENTDSVLGLEIIPKFLKALTLLQPQLEQALLQHRPDCLIADFFFPWANDVAAKFGIPRLIFHGTCCFSLCSSELTSRHQPHNQVSSDDDLFTIPDLPGQIHFTRPQIPEFIRNDFKSVIGDFLKGAWESESNCYGIVVNSFYELERDYADCYKNLLKRKAWHIGPLSLCNRDNEEKMQRGKESAIDGNECLKWLDSKKPNSVFYLCFGSMAKFNSDQLREIANGLEASGQQFIWVVRKGTEEEDDWLPDGFKERTEGKGLIIRGWAPQVLILDHPAICGFVTHCGWNSTLEGIAAGVPMVTWPVGAEQFYNEKLVTEVLKTGVGVGAKKWVRTVGDFVKSEAIEKALLRVMIGEEGEEIRNRAKEYGEKARKAIEGDDGTSYTDLNNLIEELKSLAF